MCPSLPENMRTIKYDYKRTAELFNSIVEGASKERFSFGYQTISTEIGTGKIDIH